MSHDPVRYVLIGGFAVILHGHVRGTKDIDLLVDPSDENMGRLRRAMASLPDNAIALVESRRVEILNSRDHDRNQITFLL